MIHMAAASLLPRVVFLAECVSLAIAISRYCMPPSTSVTSFFGLCKDLNEADPLSACAPGLELLGFGVDVTMCKSYGCRPSIDFSREFERMDANT